MADVVCRSCKTVCHELTEKYDPDIKCHGAMFRVKPKFVGWNPFKERETTKPGMLECPRCGTLYVNGRGKLACEVVGDIPKKKGSSIPDELNETILVMNENGSTASEIGKAIGFSRQAVTRRIMDLMKG